MAAGGAVPRSKMPVGLNFLSDVHLANPRVAQQEIWRKRLVEAENRYEEAAARLGSARAQNQGVAEAEEHRMAARAEYLRLLRIFSDLVLRGKAPNPSP